MTHRDHPLVVSGLTHSFGDRQVLDDVSFTVPSGSVFGLLGPNGAGKTTLMRCLFGVVHSDGGTITWNGQQVDLDTRATWGYMPQERGLYTDMKVIDHLVWLARLHQLDSTTARANATSLLERLGLADRAEDVIKDLSGGMQQHVQLAAALVHNPTLLVLDEPFAGLDPTAVEFLSGVIVAHVRNGGALVFSSHQLDLVEGLCESLVMIDRGRVVLSGDLDQLKAASDERFLRVDTELDRHAIPDMLGEVSASSPTGSRIRLQPGVDALAVLDVVRANHVITDFGVEAPSLSEIFLAALDEEEES